MHAAAPLSIVVVEDDRDTLDFICDLLRAIGVVPVGVQDSSGAQTVIAQARPRLIILDVEMPNLDGITLFERLRADAQTQALPIIFFTASEKLLRQRLVGYKARGVTLVAKPDTLLLRRAVQRTLGIAEAA